MNFKPLPEELTNHGYKMKMVKRTDLVAMYSKCGGFEVVAVQRHNGYEIKGQKYRLEKNFAHVTTGQIIDLKLIEDISADPWAPLSIMYVEDGMEYCQEDERGRVLNPNEKRYLTFREHFPGDEFLNFYAFFLDSLDKRRLAILGIQTARMMMERMILEQELKIQNGSSGQESSIDYQERWDAVWKELQNSHM